MANQRKAWGAPKVGVVTRARARLERSFTVVYFDERAKTHATRELDAIGSDELLDSSLGAEAAKRIQLHANWMAQLDAASRHWALCDLAKSARLAARFCSELHCDSGGCWTRQA